MEKIKKLFVTTKLRLMLNLQKINLLIARERVIAKVINVKSEMLFLRLKSA